MGRHRVYANATERQRAHRQRCVPSSLGQYLSSTVSSIPSTRAMRWPSCRCCGPFDHCITDPPYEAETHSAMRRTLAPTGSRAWPTRRLAFAPLTERQRRFLCRLRCQWLLIFCQVESGGPLPAAPRGEIQAAAAVAQAGWRAPVYGRQARHGLRKHCLCLVRPRTAALERRGQTRLVRGCVPADETVIYDYPVRGGTARRCPRAPHAEARPLLRAFVRDFTQPGDRVLDPFMGSGSTGRGVPAGRPALCRHRARPRHLRDGLQAAGRGGPARPALSSAPRRGPASLPRTVRPLCQNIENPWASVSLIHCI